MLLEAAYTVFLLCISQGCNRLKHLDVSWNQLTYIREELGIMRKHMITLTYLDTRNNPWQKVKSIRLIFRNNRIKREASWERF